MTKLRSVLSRNLRDFMKDSKGATAIEYAMMASGIAVAIVATVSLLSDNVRALYQSIVNALS